MRLEKLPPVEKLSLDLTPLIDVVFLLVLFFAVSTSFITPESLEELKNSLASYKQDKSKLTSQVEQYRYDKVNLELAIEQSKLEQVKQSQTIDQLSASLENSGATLNSKLSEIEQNQQTLRQFENKLNYFQQYQADLKGTLEQTTTDRNQLTEQLSQTQQKLADSEQQVAAQNSTISDLHKTLADLNQQLQASETAATALQKTVTERDQTLAEKNTALQTQAQQLVTVITDKDKLGKDYQLAMNLAAELRQQLTQEQQLSAHYSHLLEEKDAVVKSVQVTLTELDQDFRHLAIDDALGVQRKQDRIIINLPDNVLFDSGRAEIKSKGIAVLDKVGRILKDRIGNMTVQIGGHTDNIPLGAENRERYQDNWGLSSYRAVNVVRYFQDQIGIPAEQLSAAGYGFYQPIADNSSEQGRQLNRRIELVLLPK